MKSFGVLVLLLFLVFVSTVCLQAQSTNTGAQINRPQGMQPVDLGTYPGGTNSLARAINDYGLVVGYSDVSGVDQQHPMMIPLTGPNKMQWMDLNTLGGEGDSEAEGVSDTGVIVGHAITATGDYHAFVWTQTTGIVDLGTLIYLGHTVSTAHAVNRSGALIVGFSVNFDGSDMRPVVWTPSGGYGQGATWTIHELNVADLGGYTNGGANTVNDRGWIAGGAWSDINWSGVVWQPVQGTTDWKPMLVAGTADYPIVSPQYINDKGELVGTACKSDWSYCGGSLGEPTGGKDKSYTFTDLPSPFGTPNWEQAESINLGGDIVGGVLDQNWVPYGVVWSAKNPQFVQIVPSFPGQRWSWLARVNEGGIAVGDYGTADFRHAYAVQVQQTGAGAAPPPKPTFTFHNIDFPGANRTRARGINNDGVIVGGYRIPGVGFRAMMIQSGKFIPLAPTTILGTNWSEAFKINDHGNIVGWIIDDNGYTHGFELRQGVVTVLDFPGATNTYANGLNDSGTISGTWDRYDDAGNFLYQSGFTWKDGSFSDVVFPGAGDTMLFGINANGELTGGWDSGLSATTESGFVFSKGKFTSFDAPFPGVYITQGDDINATGKVVGQYYDDTTYLPHSFLKLGDGITSFDYPGAAYTTAWGINSAGEMVGNWYDSSGNAHGWLVQPGNKGKPSALPKPLDLIGWWPGDGNANDIRGGSNGNLMNGTTFAPGLVKQAFSFDGIDDFVDVPDTATLHAITTAVTVDAWINPQPSPTGAGWIFARRDPMVSEGIGLSINNDGFMGTALQTDVTSFLSTVDPVIQFNGQWQHVALTADTATGQVQLYLNGKPLAVKTDGGSPTVIGKFAWVSQLFLGQRQDPYTSEGEDGAAHYKGLIDEVQFYDRALTASEINAIYLAGAKGQPK